METIMKPLIWLDTAEESAVRNVVKNICSQILPLTSDMVYLVRAHSVRSVYRLSGRPHLRRWPGKNIDSKS